MRIDEFRASLSTDQPPAGLDAPLRALWWDAKDAWDQAHVCAQEDAGRDSAWVHAYLHRKEGDDPNAAYWYHRAKREHASGPFDGEWSSIVGELLARP